MIEEVKAKTWGIKEWFLLIILPLIVGWLVSLLVVQTPIVGVIYLNDAIYSNTAQDMIDQITFARENPRVKAVVLVVNSPGGTVTDTESVYMELARLRSTRPVVMMVEGMAASGAYYMASGTDYIMAKPSSEVGNIGVIGDMPPTPTVFEQTYSTGPYKLWGYPQETFVRELEMLKQGFLQAVLEGRGKALKVGKEVILRGQIWPGAEALRMGLIDALGPQSAAFEKAAQMAKISHYEVEDLRIMAGLAPVQPFPFFAMSKDGVKTAYPKDPGLYYLYVPPAEVRQ
jgi:protease IV